MKSATPGKKLDAGNPHVAPTLRYGDTGRFDEGDVAPVKPRRGSLLYSKVMAIVAAVAFIAAGWFGNQVFGPKAKPRGAVEVAPPAVSADVAKTVEFNPVTEYVGHVEPVQETDILPQIDGYVKKVCFSEGAFVKAGDVLFEIDVEQYEAARNLRYSEVRAAESKVVVAEAEVDRAKRYHRRLTAADDRGVTATERDTAETTLASAEAALKAARASVEQAKAAAAIADFNLKHTVVKAPISGRIGKALHHVGDYVSPSKSALAQVVQLDPIRVVFPVPDKQYGHWRAAAEGVGGADAPTRRLRVKLPDGTVYAPTGTLDFGNNKVDRETGTVVLYASFPNAGKALLPNAFVRILSDALRPPRRLTVPAAAVMRTGDGFCVWTIAPDGTVRAAAVEVGASWNGLTEIRKGLAEGAKIVVDGGFKLRDGLKVSVAE